MGKTVITADVAPAGGPYSPGLVTDDGWVFLAGQMGAGDTIEEQVTNAFKKISALLAGAGCTLDDVLSCQVQLSDLGAFARFNAVYEKHFAEPRPVRTTVGTALLGGGLAELTVVARRPPVP
jgi:2-iminobutanoate/2-iminopropanoate deaminase